MRVRYTYEQIEARTYEIELPDDLESPEDFRQFVLDEAPYARAHAIDFEIVD